MEFVECEVCCYEREILPKRQRLDEPGTFECEERRRFCEDHMDVHLDLSPDCEFWYVGKEAPQ